MKFVLVLFMVLCSAAVADENLSLKDYIRSISKPQWTQSQINRATYKLSKTLDEFDNALHDKKPWTVQDVASVLSCASAIQVQDTSSMAIADVYYAVYKKLDPSTLAAVTSTLGSDSKVTIDFICFKRFDEGGSDRQPPPNDTLCNGK